MYSPDEALKLGLVDKVIPQDQLEATALEELENILKVPGKVNVHNGLNQRFSGTLDMDNWELRLIIMFTAL